MSFKHGVHGLKKMITDKIGGWTTILFSFGMGFGLGAVQLFNVS